MSKRRNENTFLKVLSGVSLAVIVGGAVACIVPQSRDYILDKLAPYSNVYQLKEEDNKNLNLELEIRQNTIDLLNAEIETKNAKIEELENEKMSLESQIHSVGHHNQELRERVEDLQLQITQLEREKIELQNQINSFGQSSITHMFDYTNYDFTVSNNGSDFFPILLQSDDRLENEGIGALNFYEKSVLLEEKSLLENISFLNVYVESLYSVCINGQQNVVVVRNSESFYADYSFNVNYFVDGVEFTEDKLLDGSLYARLCSIEVDENNRVVDVRIDYINSINVNTMEISVDYNTVLEDLATKGELPAEYDIYAYSWGGKTISPEFRLVVDGCFMVGDGATGCNFILVDKGATANWENAKLISSNFAIENGIATIEIVE